VQGYAVEEATGILVSGDIDLVSVTVTSLPVTHPSYFPELVLEQGDIWKAPPLPTSKIELFVGIMSSSNHFAERMAVRKTWLQSKSIQSSEVVARFFVALVRVIKLPPLVNYFELAKISSAFFIFSSFLLKELCYHSQQHRILTVFGEPLDGL
jgi:hypothetical protein